MIRNLLCVFIIALVSCNNETKQEEIDFSTTEELQQQNVDLISYTRKRDRDIVKHLYAEALEKDSNLNALENKISEINGSVQDSLKDYTEYLEYNTLFYQSAHDHIQSIRDSTKRKYLLSYITASKEQFELRIAEHRKLKKSNSEYLTELHDQHVIMKLIVSEKLINTYQNKEPSITSLKGINEQIERLIDQSEKYTDSEK